MADIAVVEVCCGCTIRGRSRGDKPSAREALIQKCHILLLLSHPPVFNILLLAHFLSTTSSSLFRHFSALALLAIHLSGKVR